MDNDTTRQFTPKLCDCGCGQPAPLAKVTRSDRCQVRGQPVRFIRGHWGKTQTKKTIEEKFWEKVDICGPDECWNWTASLTTNGYGSLIVDGVTTNAQRISWQIHFGPIPDDIQVLHECDHRPCVNPNHLFLGTHQDNMDDRNRKNRQARQLGTTNPSAKLDESQVQQIRQLAQEHVRHADISSRFGISVSLIEKIIARKVWRHIP